MTLISTFACIVKVILAQNAQKSKTMSFFLYKDQNIYVNVNNYAHDTHTNF